MARKQIATFLAPNKGLSIVDNHAYATSGIIPDGGSGSAATTMLDFTTGEGYIFGKIDFNDNSTGGSDIYFEVFFNGQEVIQSKGGQEFLPWKYDILIPPLTHVVVKWGSQSSFNGNCFLSGRVYA